MSTDAAWEAWGKKDPYFGVVTDPKFRRENLTEEAKKAFFETGQGHVAYVLHIVKFLVDPNFVPKRALDFGCGVGRVLVPLARITEFAVGVDVSPSMLAEAKQQCTVAGLTNTQVVLSDDALSQVSGQFDFIHSCLVFQHIPVERGVAIFKQLLARLSPGGVVAIQFIYAKQYLAATNGVRKDEPDVQGKSFMGLQRVAAQKDNLVNGVPIDSHSGEPEMEMNIYPLNELMFLAHSVGAQRVHCEFGDHGGELGIFLFLQKPLS